MNPHIRKVLRLWRNSALLVSVISIFGAITCLSVADTRAAPCVPFDFSTDLWPKASEVRHQTGTNYCREFSLDRSFVAAPGGFTEEELLAARVWTLRGPHGYTDPSFYTFIGRLNGYHYGYFPATVDGPLKGHFAAWVRREPDGQTGSDLEFPFFGRAADESRYISCYAIQRFCDLQVGNPLVGLVPEESLVIRFNEDAKRGRLCFFIPLSRWDVPPARITVKVDGKPIVADVIANAYVDLTLAKNDVAANGRPSRHCLEQRSEEVLSAVLSAKKLSIEVNRDAADIRKDHDRVEMNTAGLQEAIDLAAFLTTNVLFAGRANEAELKSKADALLFGPK